MEISDEWWWNEQCTNWLLSSIYLMKQANEYTSISAHCSTLPFGKNGLHGNRPIEKCPFEKKFQVLKILRVKTMSKLSKISWWSFIWLVKVAYMNILQKVAFGSKHPLNKWPWTKEFFSLHVIKCSGIFFLKKNRSHVTDIHRFFRKSNHEHVKDILHSGHFLKTPEVLQLGIAFSRLHNKS